MRCLKLVGLAVSLSLAAAALLASGSAAFLLENLPEGVKTFKDASVGSSQLQLLKKPEAEAIICESVQSTGEETASKPPKGTAHLDFLECHITSPVSGKCTGLGELHEGEILALVDWELVFDTNPTGTLTTAVLFTLLSDVHLLCAGLVLEIMKAGGQLLCLHLEPTVSKVTHEFHCKNNGTSGDPEETKYWDTTGTEHAVTELLTSVSGGAFEMSTFVGLGTTTYVNAIAADQ